MHTFWKQKKGESAGDISSLVEIMLV